MTAPKPRTESPRPGYPSRDQSPSCRADRRRFLKQLAAGSGAALLGLPRLSHGQTFEVDFGKLASHPVPSDHDAFAFADADADAEDAVDGVDSNADRAPTSAGMEAEAEPAPPAESAGTSVPFVEENRALWVEPGYLVLVAWTRPSVDESPVAALEASADAVRTFIAGRVESVDHLHNLENLHPLERDLSTMLQPLVAPAEIRVLHLDHDCTVVCSALNPGREYPEIYDVDGGMPAPGWE